MLVLTFRFKKKRRKFYNYFTYPNPISATFSLLTYVNNVLRQVFEYNFLFLEITESITIPKICKIVRMVNNCLGRL